MKPPDINNIYEMAIRVQSKSSEDSLDVLINKVSHVISILKNEYSVQWYCFLFHNNKNGMPILPNPGYHYHIRFEYMNNIDDIKSHLPSYCEMLDRSASLKAISGINENLLINNHISEAWKILGESCEWMIQLLISHKNKVSAKDLLQHIWQFQHYIADNTGIEITYEQTRTFEENPS